MCVCVLVHLLGRQSISVQSIITVKICVESIAHLKGRFQLPEGDKAVYVAKTIHCYYSCVLQYLASSPALMALSCSILLSPASHPLHPFLSSPLQPFSSSLHCLLSSHLLLSPPFLSPTLQPHLLSPPLATLHCL